MNLKWISDPFHFIAGGKALLLGLMFIVLAAVLCQLAGVHFDGVIDAHYGPHATLLITITEGIINFLTVALVLTPFAFVLGRPGFRLIDLYGTQALARAPFVLMALLMLVGKHLGMVETSERLAAGGKPDTAELMLLIGSGLLIMAMAAWAIYLMYRSFAICTHRRGAKSVISFVIALLIAEIASKYLHAIIIRPLISA